MVRLFQFHSWLRAGLARQGQDRETQSPSNSVGLCRHAQLLAYRPRRERSGEKVRGHPAEASFKLSYASRACLQGYRGMRVLPR